MNTETLRNYGLALILTILTSGVDKSLAQTVPTPPSHSSPDGDGGNPDSGPNPNCIPGVTCLAIH